MESLNEEKQHAYLRTLTHYADMADRRAQSNEYELLVCGFAKSLEVIPVKDGSQWCCLYGINLHDGIAGFGDTPFDSMVALRNEFYNKNK